MSEIRVLNELGLEFERITSSAPRRARPRLSFTRPMAIALAVLLLAAAGGAAAAGLLPIGAALNGPHKSEVPPSLTPVARTAQISKLRRRDPLGGDPWTLRLAQTRTGGRCAAVGHVRNGIFGTTDTEGGFHPLPLLGTGTCGDVSADGAVTDLAVTDGGGGRIVTALGGVARAPIAELDVRVGGAPVTAQHAGATFLVVARGNAASTLRADARLADGTDVTLYRGK